jgi:hypothetical protein
VSLTEHTAQHLICKFQHHRRGGIYDRNYYCTRKQRANN